MHDEHGYKNAQQNISKMNSTSCENNHTLLSTAIYSKDARMFQHLQIKYDTPH